MRKNLLLALFNELFDLSGQTALITGGAGGLGKVIAEAYALAGANVALCGRNGKKVETKTGYLKVLAMATSSTNGVESITWVAQPGRFYCVVADATTDAPFAVENTQDILCDGCTTNEDCTNLVDDDCDGLFDCDDPDCGC